MSRSGNKNQDQRAKRREKRNQKQSGGIFSDAKKPSKIVYNGSKPSHSR